MCLWGRGSPLAHQSQPLLPFFPSFLFFLLPLSHAALATSSLSCCTTSTAQDADTCRMLAVRLSDWEWWGLAVRQQLQWWSLPMFIRFLSSTVTTDESGCGEGDGGKKKKKKKEPPQLYSCQRICSVSPLSEDSSPPQYVSSGKQSSFLLKNGKSFPN